MNTTKKIFWTFACIGIVCLMTYLVEDRAMIRAEAQAQPVYIPRVSGHGIDTVLSNAVLKTGARIGVGNIISNAVAVNEFRVGFAETNFGIYPLLGGSIFVSFGSSIGGFGNLGGATGWAWLFSTNVVLQGGRFIGDGSGLTNIGSTIEQIFQTNVFFSSTSYFNTMIVTNTATFNSNVNIASNITVSGKATFNQQIFITKAESSTNAGPTAAIDFAKDYYFISTNNNLSFGPATSWSTTNWNEVLYVFTNSSAAAKTITMDATYQNAKAEEGNTLYFTNVARLLVWGQHVGTGTNFDFKSR